MESMYRRVRRNGDEQDAFAPKRSRDRQPAFSRSGVRSRTKRRYSRYSRHAAKLDLRSALAGE